MSLDLVMKWGVRHCLQQAVPRRRVFPAVAALQARAVRRAAAGGAARRHERARAVRRRVDAGGAPAQRAPAQPRPVQPRHGLVSHLPRPLAAARLTPVPYANNHSTNTIILLRKWRLGRYNRSSISSRFIRLEGP